ncbi:hypothetical protein KUV46_15905 [Thalassovita mediterranea]|nr:hypothetical protein KUV46_15905 [Thalassovita mediterranea]
MIAHYIAAAIVGLLGILTVWSAVLRLDTVGSRWPGITRDAFACLFGGSLVVLALHVAGLL